MDRLRGKKGVMYSMCWKKREAQESSRWPQRHSVKKGPEMGRDWKCLRSVSRTTKEFKVRLIKQHELEIENTIFNIEVKFQVFKHAYIEFKFKFWLKGTNIYFFLLYIIICLSQLFHLHFRVTIHKSFSEIDQVYRVSSIFLEMRQGWGWGMLR